MCALNQRLRRATAAIARSKALGTPPFATNQMEHSRPMTILVAYPSAPCLWATGRSIRIKVARFLGAA